VSILRAAGIVVAAWAGSAAAAQVTVSPVQVELAAQNKSALVAVKNAGSTPARFEARIFSWSQGNDGRMQLDQTKDIRIYPLVFEIPVREERSVRLVAMIEPGAIEKTYRLVFEQIPQGAQPDGGTAKAVSILTDISLPVFLAPPEPERKPDVVDLEVSKGHARFEIVNGGNAHIRPDAVKFALIGKSGQISQEKLRDWYVLAGGRLSYDVRMPDDCRRVKAVEVEVVLETGTIRKTAEVASGACRP